MIPFENPGYRNDLAVGEINIQKYYPTDFSPFQPYS